ncbi:MAG: MFS transporter [Actinobacteria bacterium]|nr:MFS transporter [Actinomycetota bacterium]
MSDTGPDNHEELSNVSPDARPGPSPEPPEPDSPIRGIKRNVFILGITSFLTDLSSEIVYPLVPIFLTSVLGAPYSVVGLIEGIAESTASVVKVFSGWLSDRWQRRRGLAILGYGVSSLSKPLMAAATVWPAVLALRFGDRLGKGIRNAPRDALIADSTEQATRGRAFGFHRAADTAGAALGSLLALAMLGFAGEQFRTIFLISAIPAALGVASLFLVRERVHAHRQSKPPRLSLSQFDRRFNMFLLASAVLALGNSSDAFLILRAQNLGLSAFAAVLAYVIFNLVYSALSMPAGSLSDRIGRRRVIGAGFVVFSLVYLGFGLAPGAVAVWPLFAVYGLYMAMTEGVGKAFAADMAPANARGTALGTYYTVTGLLTFFSSLFAGLLWDALGPRAPFLFGSVLGMAATALLLLALRERR